MVFEKFEWAERDALHRRRYAVCARRTIFQVIGFHCLTKVTDARVLGNLDNLFRIGVGNVRRDDDRLGPTDVVELVCTEVFECTEVHVDHLKVASFPCGHAKLFLTELRPTSTLARCLVIVKLVFVTFVILAETLVLVKLSDKTPKVERGTRSGVLKLLGVVDQITFEIFFHTGDVSDFESVWVFDDFLFLDLRKFGRQNFVAVWAVFGIRVGHVLFEVFDGNHLDDLVFLAVFGDAYHCKRIASFEERVVIVAGITIERCVISDFV